MQNNCWRLKIKMLRLKNQQLRTYCLCLLIHFFIFQILEFWSKRDHFLLKFWCTQFIHIQHKRKFNILYTSQRKIMCKQTYKGRHLKYRTFLTSFFKDFIYWKRGEGREKEGERNIDIKEIYQSVASCTPPPWGPGP